MVLTSSSSSNKESGAFVVDLLVGRDVVFDVTVLLDENKSCTNQRNITMQSIAIHSKNSKWEIHVFPLKKMFSVSVNSG